MAVQGPAVQLTQRLSLAETDAVMNEVYSSNKAPFAPADYDVTRILSASRESLPMKPFDNPAHCLLRFLISSRRPAVRATSFDGGLSLCTVRKLGWLAFKATNSVLNFALSIYHSQ
jgi:hypothetical protein